MAEAFAVVALSSRISVLLAHDRHGTPASESALNSRVVGYPEAIATHDLARWLHCEPDQFQLKGQH
jgi:hypothetical protein